MGSNSEFKGLKLCFIICTLDKSFFVAEGGFGTKVTGFFNPLKLSG